MTSPTVPPSLEVDFASEDAYMESDQYIKDTKIFSESIIHRKIDVIETLQTLHTKGDHSRLCFMKVLYVVLSSVEYRDQMHEMYDAGMLDVLVDIAESWDYEVVLVERKVRSWFTTPVLRLTHPLKNRPRQRNSSISLL